MYIDLSVLCRKENKKADLFEGKNESINKEERNDI